MARDYEQYCGLATGLDVIGEKWTLLLIRELLLGPKRFTDLVDGLPGIPPSLLSARLKDLQSAGVISREVLPPPAASTVYRLTDAGKELKEALYALARWGARFGRKPRPNDAARPEWGVFALRCLFRPEAATGVHDVYELRLPAGTLRLTVDDGVLEIGGASGSKLDLVLTGEMPTLMAALMGRLTPEEAVQSGKLEIDGDPKALERVLEMFRLVETTVAERTPEPQGANQENWTHS
jgi:DNA-binding HxlR family transcriptional regulator